MTLDPRQLSDETKQAIQRGLGFLEQRDLAPWLDLPPELTDALEQDLNTVAADPTSTAPYVEPTA